MQKNQIEALLDFGPRNSKGHADEVSKMILNEPSLLPELFHFLNSSNKALVSRAAHVLMQLSEKRPHLLANYKDQIISDFAKREQWEVREQMSKIIPTLPLGKVDLPVLFNLFQSYLEDSHAFVRVCGLQALSELCKIERSLIPSVEQIIKNQMSFDKASIKARGRKLLQHLAKIS